MINPYFVCSFNRVISACICASLSSMSPPWVMSSPTRVLPIGVERMRLSAPNKLEIVNTYYSKIALTEPYTFTLTKTRVPTPMSEDICAQNNRDINGKGGQMFNTTPPPLR